ncbi:MAG: hypothetical protein ACJASV_000345 [Pseudorhodobacter sp.]|jgi:hypothetical protein
MFIGCPIADYLAFDDTENSRFKRDFAENRVFERKSIVCDHTIETCDHKRPKPKLRWRVKAVFC